MGQIYLQRFAYRGAIDKAAFDAVWGIADEAMAKTGNWGNVAKGVKHIQGYLTASGGYALIDVEDPRAFDQYQSFQTNNFAHIATITFEPLTAL